MEVRRVREGDARVALECLQAFEVEGPDRMLSEKDVRRFLSRPENILLVAESAGEPIGFALAYRLDRVDRERPMVCLYEIGVSEGHRRSGVGTALVGALRRVGEEIGAVKTWTITNRSNEAAVRLFERTGARAPAGDDIVYVYGA